MRSAKRPRGRCEGGVRKGKRRMWTTSNLVRHYRKLGFSEAERERMTSHVLWLVTFYDRFTGKDGLLKDGRFDVEEVRWEGCQRRELVGAAVRSYDLPGVPTANAFLPGSEVVDM